MLKFNLKPTNWNLIFVVVFAVLMVVLGPLLVIQALNTLFGLNIEFSLTNWTSVIILHAFFHSAVSLK
jgi:hypothetical protein